MNYRAFIAFLLFLLCTQLQARSIVVKTSLSEAESVQLLSQYGTVTRTISSLNVFVLEVSGELSSITNDIEANAWVIYAEEDGGLLKKNSKDDYFINDPEAVNQWFLDNMQMYEVWKYFPWKDENKVTLAIVDDGLYADMDPDLANLIISPLSYNIIDKNTNITADNQHGTIIAALVAAAVNNSIGTAGLAPKLELMILQIYNAAGSSWSALAEGIVYAADNGVRSITTTTGGVGGAKVVEDAVNYIVSKGALLTTSGGNSYQDGNALFCPPCYNQSIGVGGLQEDGTWWIYANTGPQIDIVAPASKLRAPDKGVYTDNYGTSYSAPLVGACLAYIWNQNPSLTNDQVLDILYSTAHDLGEPGRDDFYGWGNVNLLLALKVATNKPPTVTSATVVNVLQGSAINQSFEIAAPEAWDSVEISVTDASSFNYTITDNTVYFYSALKAIGTYTVKVSAVDSLNAMSSFDLTINVVATLTTPTTPTTPTTGSVSNAVSLSTGPMTSYLFLLALFTVMFVSYNLH